MGFKTGILIDSLRVSFDEALKFSSGLGVDGIQMYVSPHHMASLEFDYKKAPSLKRKISEHNLEISALCGDLGGHGFERPDENSSKIKKTIDIINFASELGTRVVTTHIGVVSETGERRNNVMMEALREICTHAEKEGVYIAIETGPEKSEVLRKFIDDTGEKYLKVNFDPANLLMVHGENPASAVLTLRDYIVHTHAKDGRMISLCDPVVIYNAFAEGNPDNINIDEFFVELPLGSGDVGFDKYLESLKDTGYTGYLTIEREAGNSRLKDITDGVNFLKGEIK